MEKQTGGRFKSLPIKVLILWQLVGTALLFLPPLAIGQEALVLYDDFNQRFLNPAKWFVGQSCRDTTAFALDCVVEIEKGQLRLADRVSGATGSNAGGQFSGAFLHFPNAAQITRMRADVTVNEFDVVECPNNPGAQTRIFLRGTFFNADVPVPGSPINDVAATFALEWQPGLGLPKKTLRAVAFVDQCLDASCSTGNPLGFVEMGTVRLGQPVSMEVEWRQAEHRFLFTRSGGFTTIDYTVSDTAPPGSNGKSLFVGNFAHNCTASPRPAVYMEAFVDNVWLNSSAVP